MCGGEALAVVRTVAGQSFATFPRKTCNAIAFTCFSIAAATAYSMCVGNKRTQEKKEGESRHTGTRRGEKKCECSWREACICITRLLTTAFFIKMCFVVGVRRIIPREMVRTFSFGTVVPFPPWIAGALGVESANAVRIAVVGTRTLGELEQEEQEDGREDVNVHLLLDRQIVRDNRGRYCVVECKRMDLWVKRVPAVAFKMLQRWFSHVLRTFV